MGQSPFARRDLSSQSVANRRRSSRIDYETPVVLSGRDATGRPFREETTTLIVNFHGAKVRTQYQVLVGMLVTIDSLRTGLSGKAVCVNVYEAVAGESHHEIALQLVHPGNIWGVENPPPDWATVAAELGGRTLTAEQVGRAPATPFKPAAPTLATGSASPAPVSSLASDAQLIDFEQRAARLMDSVLETLRVQANVALRNALSNHEQRLAALVSDGEIRLSQRTDQAAAELAATMEALRTEVLEEMVQEFQRRLTAVGAEQEGRISHQIDALGARAEERLAQLASKGAAQADSTLATLQEQMNARAAETIRRFAEDAEKSLPKPEAILAGLEQRVSVLTSEGERRIGERLDKAFSELDAALATFRSDLADELAARREEAVKEAEQALRSRVAAILSSVLGQPQKTAEVPAADAGVKE
jgi:hypothetical protein